MKKKRLVPLVILCAVLACVIALYVALSAYNSKKESESTKDGDTVAERILSVSENDVTSLTYKSEKYDISLEKKNGEWIFPDDEAYPVDADKVSKMISAVCTLSFERTVDGTDSENYGLDEPQLTVTLGVGEENYIFTLGDTNSYNSLSYLGFEGALYMINDTLSGVFEVSREDLFDVNDEFPSEITADSVSSIEISSNGETNTVGDGDGIEEFIHVLQKYCSFASPEGYGLDEDGLAEYGIDEDSPRVSVNYSTDSAKAIFEIVFGKNSDGDAYYTLPDSDTTYSADADGYREILNYIYYSPSTEADTTSTSETSAG